MVELADGEKLHADVIIAADGIHSVGRTAVLGQKLVANRSGHSAYRALVSLAVCSGFRAWECSLTTVLVRQIPRDRLLDNPRALAILDGDEKGMGLTTFMGSDRRLVAYPCRKGTLLNIVAIVVRLWSSVYKLRTITDLTASHETAGLGSGEFY